MKIPIALINVGDRLRKDLGDIKELADSISEHGLIQPIVINQNNDLIAGGRRLAAHKHLGLDTIDVVYRETLTPDQLRMMELEENVRRKEMTWQERVMSINEIHTLKSRDAALQSKPWGMRETGEVLGVAFSNVGYATQVAKLLLAKDEAISKCVNMREAVQVMMQRKEDEANRLLAKTVLPQQKSTIESIFADEDEEAVPVTQSPNPSVDVSKICFLGDSVGIMSKMPDACVDHVISDPPYGIDMDMLDQQTPHGGMSNIERTKDEHTVEGNVALFHAMLPQMFRIIKPSGFCILWCDIMQWQLLYDLGIKAGFRVQRWPITWIKTHACINQTAQYNFTKTTEIAIVMRKPSATLVKPQSSCHVLSSNDTLKKEFSHPFAKPAAIWRYLFQAVTIPGQTVLDPFAGIGSSTIPAIECGLRPVAIELVETHYNILVENVKQTIERVYK